ncbi:Gliding motility protein GldB [Flavobacterium sp. 9AF]|uniref:gliding motility lipoprotein GldB n=1 Tax=Flavobacterium sp. 9AF TaxID=2653142 RepID=UPI0012F35F9A|nr:gliding motility lipoprotein GldB [Flavobacterium sp. 9AF]VXB10151.1 Gliding motility protein GldB [Flavobacterium sp. 9AF]
MKKLFLASLLLLIIACKQEDKIEEKVAEIPVEFKVERFDKLFYESDSLSLKNVKAKYPFLFPDGNEDTVWTNKLKNPLFRDLYKEVIKKYPNTSKLENDLENLFQHVQYYFPKYKTPRVITIISEVDREAKTIYADSIAFISLDCYLGKDHPFYVDFSEYQRFSFEENQIIPDLVSSFSYGKIARPLDRTLLSIMIYYGKELYLKDKLIPEYADATKIGYTEQQLAWCKENEYQMWSYFIENNLLYESNVKNEFRFINEAPFSKFYLEIDNESPGRVGQWLGWQIVRSYMDNNDVSLEQLLATDAKTIFEKSKYKPNK